MATRPEGSQKEIANVRMAARIAAGIIAGFLVLFGIGEIIEGRARSSTAPTSLATIFGLSLFVIYGASMALSLKWERPAVLLAVASLAGMFVMLIAGSFTAQGGVGASGALNPLLLTFWLPIVLYLCCWGLEAQQKKRSAAN